MLNPYDHEDAEPSPSRRASRIEPIEALIDAACDDDAELVYVNDNYDDFTATSKDLGRGALNGRHPELVEPILPPKGALFVQKVRHSAFYESALNHLLHIHEIETLVLAGQVTEQCILYTALDAYVRGFEIRVARGRRGPDRRRARRRGAADDGAQHARRDRRRGRCSRLGLGAGAKPASPGGPASAP